MSAVGVGGIDDFVHGIFRIDNRTAGEIRVFRNNVIVHLTAEIDNPLLLRVLNNAGTVKMSGSDRRRKHELLLGVSSEEVRVTGSCPEHAFRSLRRIFRNRSKSVHAASVHACAYAARLGSSVLNQIAL